MVFPSKREKDPKVTLKILWPELKTAGPENRQTSPRGDFTINYEGRCLPRLRGRGAPLPPLAVGCDFQDTAGQGGRGVTVPWSSLSQVIKCNWACDIWEPSLYYVELEL